jgi:hypothetical protein
MKAKIEIIISDWDCNNKDQLEQKIKELLQPPGCNSLEIIDLYLEER